MKGLGEAIALAADVHQGQFDKAGAPYILHCLEVMRRATDYYTANSDGWRVEEIQIVAVLHDSLEDLEGKHTWSRGRLGDRIYADYGSEVYSAVDALTKRTFYAGATQPVRETYDEYIGRVSRNWRARIVKIADLSHNLDAFRIPSAKIEEHDFKRWDKYHRALVKLTREEVINHV